MSVERIEVNGHELTAFDLPPEPSETYEVHVDGLGEIVVEKGKPPKEKDVPAMYMRKLVPELCEQNAELHRENAKLRELAVLQSVIFKHMSTCPTTDCQVCPVKEECAESVHLEGLLGIDDKETSWLVQWRSEDAADVRAENAKLREYLQMAVRIIDVAVEKFGYNAHPDELEKMHKETCELGIEVK